MIFFIYDFLAAAISLKTRKLTLGLFHNTHNILLQLEISKMSIINNKHIGFYFSLMHFLFILPTTFNLTYLLMGNTRQVKQQYRCRSSSFEIWALLIYLRFYSYLSLNCYFHFANTQHPPPWPPGEIPCSPNEILIPNSVSVFFQNI